MNFSQKQIPIMPEVWNLDNLNLPLEMSRVLHIREVEQLIERLNREGMIYIEDQRILRYGDKVLILEPVGFGNDIAMHYGYFTDEVEIFDTYSLAERLYMIIERQNSPTEVVQSRIEVQDLDKCIIFKSELDLGNLKLGDTEA